MGERDEFKKYLITIVHDFFYKHFYTDETLLTKRSARFVLSMHFISRYWSAQYIRDIKKIEWMQKRERGGGGSRPGGT